MKEYDLDYTGEEIDGLLEKVNKNNSGFVISLNSTTWEELMLAIEAPSILLLEQKKKAFPILRYEMIGGRLEITYFNGEKFLTEVLEEKSNGLIKKSSSHNYYKDYLTFEAIQDESSVKIIGCAENSIWFFKKNDNGWLPWDGEEISLDTGDKVCISGNNSEVNIDPVDEEQLPEEFDYDDRRFSLVKFGFTGKVKVYGNIMSLLYVSQFEQKTEMKNSCFAYTFEKSEDSEQSGLVSARNLMLPNTLAEKCYLYMFHGCNDLIELPKLSATTLRDYCYTGMFIRCENLTDIPQLPAINLVRGCYSRMFMCCTSLKEVEKLPAVILMDSCYSEMFSWCTELTNAPILPAATLKPNCYYKMFEGCRSLKNSPELLAKILVENCYLEMFSGCTELNHIKCLAVSLTADNCTTNWVNNVSTTGTFERDMNANWDSGTNGIPEEWEEIIF